MKYILYLFFTFSMLSCKSSLYKIYEKGLRNKEEYVFVDKEEIKKIISLEKEIYYIKEDINYYYFKIYNSSFPVKFILKFKAEKDDIIIDNINIDKRIKILFEKDNKLRVISQIQL